jgi:phospholipid transport system substrate-binding protein
MQQENFNGLIRLTGALQRLITVVFMVASLATVVHVERATAADTASFVDDLAQKAIAISTDESRSQEQKVGDLRELFRTGFDVDYIGRYVLGRYWRRASDEERATYLAVFEDYIVHSYAVRFARFNGGDLEIGRADHFQDGVHRVQSVFHGNDGQDARLDWFVHESGAGLKAVDVVVEGVSLRKAQRDEFMAVIRQGGGTVAGLIDNLRKLVEKMKTA